MNNGKKLVSTILCISICLTITYPYHHTTFLPTVKADGVPSAWHNSSLLSVQIIHQEPRINWYDFQYNDSGNWTSRLNQQIEVDNVSEYRFIINISSDQGWSEIEFINLTAWYDQGDDTTSYNDTKGGNFNLYIQYENTTATGNNSQFRDCWPTDGVEVDFLTEEERVVNDNLYGLPGFTEARNITFPFIPNKQFRYAPGENSTWDEHNSTRGNSSIYGLYNNYSWNFNITIDDSAGYQSWVSDEFGVYRYSEIVSAENPSILGYPNGNFTVNDLGGSGNVSIITCSNGNFNLSVNLSDLTHQFLSTLTIDKSNVYVRGGNRTTFKSLSSLAYLFGGNQTGMPNYRNASANGTQITTSDVEYACFIPVGSMAGEYSSQIYYHLSTEEE